MKEGAGGLKTQNFRHLFQFATRSIQSTRYVLHKGPANQEGFCISRKGDSSSRWTGLYRKRCARHLEQVLTKAQTRLRAPQATNWVTWVCRTWEGARYAKSGACGEHGAGVFTWALRYAANIRIVFAIHDSDHTYCMFLARSSRHSVHCVVVDSWVHSHPVVCLPHEHHFPMSGIKAYGMVDLVGAPAVSIPSYDQSIMEAAKQRYKKREKNKDIEDGPARPEWNQPTNWTGNSFFGHVSRIQGRPFTLKDIAVPLPPLPPPSVGVRDHQEQIPGLPPGPLERFPAIANGPIE
ncbi:MAG: hypothetical protein AAF355_08910 [Myxococcota bacterium]